MAVFQSTPTITAGAYSADDILGDVSILAGAALESVMVSHVGIFDDAGQKAQIDFFIFDAALVGTYTDNAAFAIDAADKASLRGIVTVFTTDYIDAGSDAFGQTAASPHLLIDRLASEATLSIVAVVRGTPTYAATSDIRFEFGFIRVPQ